MCQALDRLPPSCISLALSCFALAVGLALQPSLKFCPHLLHRLPPLLKQAAALSAADCLPPQHALPVLLLLAHPKCATSDSLPATLCTPVLASSKGSGSSSSSSSCDFGAQQRIVWEEVLRAMDTLATHAAFAAYHEEASSSSSTSSSSTSSRSSGQDVLHLMSVLIPVLEDLCARQKGRLSASQ